MNEEIPQEVVEARAQFILEYTKLVLPSTLEALKKMCSPGVTFTDKQRDAIEKQIREAKENCD